MRLDHLLSKETEEVGVALLLICQRGKSRKRIMNWWLCAKRIAGEEIRNKNTSGGDALGGHTRSHPEHDG